jgi:hypothetical protein
MNLQEIEDLIGKYERGESSLRDEKVLRSFFEKEEVPFHLAGYRELFRYFHSAGKEELSDPGFEKRLKEKFEETGTRKIGGRRMKRLFPALAVAASLILLFGIVQFMQNRNPDPGTFEDPQIAYAETKKVLLKISGEMNAGMNEMSSIQEFHSGVEDLGKVKTFQDGLQNLQKISVLDKSKDIISQKTKTQ